MKSRLLGIMFLSGCTTGSVLDASYDGGPAFSISGDVDPRVERIDNPAIAMLWAWSSGGAVGGAVEVVPSELQLFRYTAEVPPPPVDLVADGTVPDGWEGLGAVDLLIGIPILVDASIDLPVVEPHAALAWVADAAPLHGVIAVADGHAAVVFDPTLGVDHLGDAPSWTGHCVLDDAMKGFTLYRRETDGCGAWRALAPPGERSEYQGVTLTPVE